MCGFRANRYRGPRAVTPPPGYACIHESWVQINFPLVPSIVYGSRVRRLAESLDRWAPRFLSRTARLLPGVARAVATVTAAIEEFGAPVYVRKQLVHNDSVIDALSANGAIFVDELDLPRKAPR